MKKRDILTPSGITLGFIMIMLAILTNSGVEGASSFLDISSIFIVIGGLIASLLINFKMSQIKLTGRVLKEAFRQKDLELLKLIQLFINLSEQDRKSTRLNSS